MRGSETDRSARCWHNAAVRDERFCGVERDDGFGGAAAKNSVGIDGGPAPSRSVAPSAFAGRPC